MCTLTFRCFWMWRVWTCLFILRPKKLPRSISRLAISCIYLPPSLNNDQIEQAYDYLTVCYDKLVTESPDTRFIITGDFNPISNGFDFKILTSHCKFKQLYLTPTRNDAILDLIFTDRKEFYNDPCCSLSLGNEWPFLYWLENKTFQPYNK